MSTVIRSFVARAFGGAIAPTKKFWEVLASMASETSGPQGGVERSNGVAHANGKRAKLHGRAFYESIGSPKLVLAPMVEQSEFVRFLSTQSPLLCTVSPANTMKSTGMATPLTLVSSSRPAKVSLSIHAHVPFENVRREEQLPR